MKITKTRGEIVNIGNYENVRLEVTLSSEKSFETSDEIKVASKKLNDLAAEIIAEEVLEVKRKRGIIKG